ncbi:MAG TPA: glycoside hydrolase family 2 TIM barrel-domain containing protein [Ignavibacteriaceae bacterium]|nr:glycoside hydrolase family 2 TIM barrel-domain containing protein [Ignavibacteriaceae bacterium]
MKINFLSFKHIILNVLLIIAFQPLLTAQVVFRDLPQYKINSADLLFFDITDTRNIISLNGDWQVYSAEDENKNKVYIGIPSIFKGYGSFVFEKTFKLTSEELNRNRIKLVFFGLNYTADISVNGNIIYRHSGGEFPFTLDLPRDILQSDNENLISVSLSYKLDSQNTIPFKQRFLFPQNFGGIIRDVYLHLTPNINIKDVSLSGSINLSNKRAVIEINSLIENRDFKKVTDTVALSTNFSLRVKAYSPSGTTELTGTEIKFELKQNRETEIKHIIQVNDPLLWSPASPGSYIIRIELYRYDELVDITDRSIVLYDLRLSESGLMLNGAPLQIRGVTYMPSFENYGSLSSYAQMEKDLIIIKETGFNFVRFSKTVPHPYYLKLCEELGLLAFIEIPAGSIPENLANDQNFMARNRNYLASYLKAYSGYSAVAAIGLGSSYLYSIESHRSLLVDLGEKVKTSSSLMTYASFSGLDAGDIENIDLYGVELLNAPFSDLKNKLNALEENTVSGRLFISEATYTVNVGQTDGYVNYFSYEAQAKYFEDLLTYTDESEIAGFFINTMFDMYGDYPSILSGYEAGLLYNIGIAGVDRDLSRIAYKVINAKLKNAERVTIPIGSTKDDAPMVFIIVGLLLAIFMGILVNSGRKFREDASRALLRPYNFFADIRDQRIISAYHSLFLAIIVSVTGALLTSNILYYLKTNILFEKVLLAFGSPDLVYAASYFSWNPISALVWLSLLHIAVIVIFTLLVRSASMFVKTKVYLSSALFAIVWALLPLVLLIPLGIILYRLLMADVANLYVFIVLFIFSIWLIYRLMKGIYVIYDVSAGPVYFYSILLFLLVFGGFLIYFQVSNSVIQHLMLILKQSNILG